LLQLVNKLSLWRLFPFQIYFFI